MRYHGSTSSEGAPGVVRFTDLFCGIGGFRYALETIGAARHVETECVFSSDIDRECQRAYAANFGEIPHGDITGIDARVVPDHDILLAGFPCQPFSIIGQMKGFEDTRGTLFFDIARVLEARRPSAFVLENVKLLKGHNQGQTLRRIRETLSDLGYYHEYRILNALDFGLPQKRERIWIVGLREGRRIPWPIGGQAMKPLSEVLQKEVPAEFYVSEPIRRKRWSVLKPTQEPTIWHENKAGHISAYPFSCALRAGASYNYLLVNGERRLTPREMLRLQGFPEAFRIVCNDYQTRKQAGNSLPVNVAAAVLDGVFDALNFAR
jgi:DNA (cytosine-5)-methyltransferase 1